MPDPDATNLTDFHVRRVDYAHPLFNKYKLSKRMQTLRRDFETGELDSDNVMALSLTAAHTLVIPGDRDGDAEDTDKTEITSRLIMVTTDGSARTLTLPAAADFEGTLNIVHVAGAGDLVVSGAGGTDVSLTAATPELETFMSDGTDWFAGSHANNEPLTDETT